MISLATPGLTLEAFLSLPEGETAYELIDGQAIAKMSPQRFHSRTSLALINLLQPWVQGRGELGIEWAVILTRRDRPWVPVPDLLYVSNERIAVMGDQDGACPVPPELAIEIISPDQSFGDIAEKAIDYLAAGVLRVWVVDPKAKSITVFAPDTLPVTYRGDRPLTDPLLPDLAFSTQEIFGLNE
jgi:Uma2 family endonuclease